MDADIFRRPAGMSCRDYLIKLLDIAAEFEHGLLVQYLYAAYSLDTRHPTLASKAQRWRDFILTVAKEEMGHLLTVQNLLSFLGGPISVTRPDFPWDSPLNPYPFHLRPLSIKSLAFFVHGEMPPRDELKELEKRRRNSNAFKFINKNFSEIQHIVDPHLKEQPARARVGQIYEQIIAILEDPRQIRDADFRADTFAVQASWDEWGRRYRPAPARPGKTDRPKGESKIEVIVRRMATRTEAVEAMREVAGQGEAAHVRSKLEGEESHFDRFVTIYQEFSGAEGDKPVYSVPTDPTTSGSDRHPGRITAEPSLAWANLFNVRYRMLLTYLTHSYRLARATSASPSLRGAVMHKVFGEMYNLKAIAGILVRSPLRPDCDPNERAGAPFEMPYDLTLPLDEIDCWQLHREILRSSESLCEKLLEFPKLCLTDDGESEGRRYLGALRELDGQSCQWIESILTGLCGGR
jgi:hypothetical protein